MAIRFISKATVKNKLVRSSNVWDGTAVFNPFTLVGNYDALATVTVPSGGLSSITFAGIPTTGYSHLQIRFISRDARTSASNSPVDIRFNADSGANYSSHDILGDGSSVSAVAETNVTRIRAYGAASTLANNYGAGIVDILDYANVNKYKTTKQLQGNDQNGSGAIDFGSGSWRSFSAINQITLIPFTSPFAQYSSFALYGVKA
jgi:hypothetical protein